MTSNQRNIDPVRDSERMTRHASLTANEENEVHLSPDTVDQGKQDTEGVESENNEDFNDQKEQVETSGKITNSITESETEEEEDPFRISIKDFAYDISDPRHFGIYDDVEYLDDDDEEDYEYEEDEVDDEEYPYNENDTPGYNEGMFTAKSAADNDIGRDGEEYGIYTENNVATDDTYYGHEDGNNEILHAVALYPFVPENSNELSLVPNQLLIINYECGDGWLVAHDPETGETGLVPSEYIKMLEVEPTEDDYDAAEYNEFAEDAKDAHRFLPEILENDEFIPEAVIKVDNVKQEAEEEEDDEVPVEKLEGLKIQ